MLYHNNQKGKIRKLHHGQNAQCMVNAKTRNFCERFSLYFSASLVVVVVVYHVTIVAIGHGLLKKFWPFGTRLRSTYCREFNYIKLCSLAYFIRTTQQSISITVVTGKPGSLSQLLNTQEMFKPRALKAVIKIFKKSSRVTILVL